MNNERKIKHWLVETTEDNWFHPKSFIAENLTDDGVVFIGIKESGRPFSCLKGGWTYTPVYEEENEAMSKFKVGDEVTIVKGSEYDRGTEANPSHGTKGVIILLLGDKTFKVEWPNGYINYYNEKDLEHYEDRSEDRSNYHPHHDLIVAWAKGAKIQFRLNGKGWIDFVGKVPSWNPEVEYRIKPEPTPQELEKQAIEEEMRKLSDRLKELDCK